MTEATPLPDSALDPEVIWQFIKRPEWIATAYVEAVQHERLPFREAEYLRDYWRDATRNLHAAYGFDETKVAQDAYHLFIKDVTVEAVRLANKVPDTREAKDPIRQAVHEVFEHRFNRATFSSEEHSKNMEIGIQRHFRNLQPPQDRQALLNPGALVYWEGRPEDVSRKEKPYGLCWVMDSFPDEAGATPDPRVVLQRIENDKEVEVPLSSISTPDPEIIARKAVSDAVVSMAERTGLPTTSIEESRVLGEASAQRLAGEISDEIRALKNEGPPQPEPPHTPGL